MYAIENNLNIKKILPVKYPPITSFPQYADFLSIALVEDRSLHWLYSHFIQLRGYYKKGYPYIKFDDLPPIEECPFCNEHILKRNFILNKWKDIVDFCIYSINLGYYIIINVDRYFLPVFDGYNKIHNIHPTLIYGYNIEKAIFNVADFYKDNKYSYSIVNFEDLNKAFINFKFSKSIIRDNSKRDISDIHASKLYSLSVSDRFSDLGLVGAFEINCDTLTLFSLSCRALGREIENKMIEFIADKYQIKNIEFKATGKNDDVKILLLRAFPGATLKNFETL